ncbi:MAG: preprotein translocase subunit SecG [Acidobacteriia bacterium]|nr:preprotein translocase subunit SecG [Terriglobia bacterium]
MLILLTIIHVIVCLFLIIVVLLQSGKAADLAGAFGGMGSQTAFGPRGSATVLTKATTIAAAVFMVTSLSLSIAASRRAGTASTVLEKVAAPAPTKQEQKPFDIKDPANRPTMTLTPEGADPSKSVTIPLDIAPGPPPVATPPAPAQKGAPAKK